MDKILFVVPHGLGDCVMLTPALKKYKETNKHVYVAVLGLERFGKTLTDLLSNLDFIDEVVPILPDPWRDGPDKYQTHLDEVLKVADTYGKNNQFNKGIFLPTNKQDGFRLHKIFRFESEVGVGFSCIDDLQTILHVDKNYTKKAKEFLSSFKKPIALFHNKAGNPPKEFSEEEATNILANFPEYTILEFGKDVPDDDMEFTKAVINEADIIVAIDSVVMHIAGAFKKDLVALFKSTPVHQAIPLTYNVKLMGYSSNVTQLQEYPMYRYAMAEVYGFPTFDIGTPLIQEGIQDDNSIPKSSTDGNYTQIQYEVEKHDGPIRMTLAEHGDEAIRFFQLVSKHLPNPEDLPSEIGNARVLDMGCNTGYHTKMLAEKYGKSTGIDINPLLIKAAKKNWKHCRTMDMHNMTFKKDTFDFIFAKDVLEHSYDPDKVLSKMYKILKNNGYVLAFIPMDGSVDGNAFVDTDFKHGYTAHSWKSTFDDCVLRFSNAGFKDIKLHKHKVSEVIGRKRALGDDIGIIIARKHAN